MLSTASSSSLILASGSSIRASMLEAAGVVHQVQPAAIDEDALKQAAAAPAELARQLAEAKAIKVGKDNPDAWVIGSDSIASVDGRMFGKPRNREEAGEHLRQFSGRSLILTSAVALARGGRIEWSDAEEARLQVRPLSDEFIASYLDAEWPDVGHCVGVFRMEGRGVQLFERVDGDHFTILGMPLLPLLGALRERGVIPS